MVWSTKKRCGRDADEVIKDEEIAGGDHIEGLSGDMIQVIVDGEEDGASDDGDDDEGGSEGKDDDLDNDEALEAMEGITGDDNGNLVDHSDETQPPGKSSPMAAVTCPMWLRKKFRPAESLSSGVTSGVQLS
ncbi:MAG: hypothetical protein Q9192_008219, partial [Flavoplaca navasiana]